VEDQPVWGSDLGPANWSRRYKANIERLRSGDRSQITEVVRQLSDRERAKGISQGERRMLARARQMLDGPGDPPTGVREPRRPFPPNYTIGIALSES
jgi:CarD family transcriptional regulator